MWGKGLVENVICGRELPENVRIRHMGSLTRAKPGVGPGVPAPFSPNRNVISDFLD